MLEGKKIVLGVTGSIAAYKAAVLASTLSQAGAQIDVIMTESATKLIAPLTFQSLTRRPVHVDMFRLLEQPDITHVSLGVGADLLVIAPATANILAKMAWGMADDLLSTTVLAARCPIIVAPAMDAEMYENSATQENVARLRERGVVVVEPDFGRLASGLVGRGRLAEPEEILGRIRWVLGRDGDLADAHLLVTAGGTQEPLDPVRVITNRSSGKMGYAIAEAALDRGASVTLISAPTSLKPPRAAEFIPVTTAVEMCDAVMEKLRHADALVMAAAVADYRVDHAATQKMKRGDKTLQIALVPNPDILMETAKSLEGGRAPIRVGFALESEKLESSAREKLARKRLDLIVANRVDAAGGVFGSDQNEVVMLDRSGQRIDVPLASKVQVAHRILDQVVQLLRERR
ncbi:MAG: bifunctional phosphopantothenoylcysteine decarboxylase/phosphopantothenate--cysteine ligase CoaBC [Chloroflexota bacterium]